MQKESVELANQITPTYQLKEGIEMVPDVSNTKTGLVFNAAKFLKERNKIASLFKEKGLKTDEIAKVFKDNSIQAKLIPAEKIGSDFTPEYRRLMTATTKMFELTGRNDLATKFKDSAQGVAPENVDVSYIASLLHGCSHPVAVENEMQKLEVIRPLVPVLKEALNDKGVYAPDKLPELTLAFYNDFLIKNPDEKINIFEENFGPDLSPQSTSDKKFDWGAVVDGVVGFASNLVKQKQAGVDLPRGLDSIANGTIKVQDALTTQVERQVDQQIGGTVRKNVWLFVAIGVVGLVVVILLVRYARKS